MRRLLLVGCVVLGACGVVVATRDVGAQHLDPRRPATFVVGAPGGAAPMVRGDARRRGFAAAGLPSGPLRIAWRKTLGIGLEQPALATAEQTLAIVTARGDVVFLDGTGDELARTTVGGGAASPATMTSDGTVVFVTSGGDAVGVRRTSVRPRFTTRLGGDRNVRSAPLALDDGGTVVATTADLVVLDADGNVRARTSLPESPAAPLLATADRILAVTTSGTVFGWIPGREPVRVGAFGAPIDGGAALVSDTTLLAVIEGNHLVELDVVRGGRATRAIAAQGLYLGPPAVRGSSATLLGVTSTRTFLVDVDASGQEARRAVVGTFATKTLADGGAAPLTAPPHASPLVDPRGAAAFATPDNHVGVITAEGVVETIGEPLCSSAVSGRAGVAGLTPWGRGAFAVVCEGGSVVRIEGPDAEPLRKSSLPRRAPPPSAKPPPSPPEAPADEEEVDDDP